MRFLASYFVRAEGDLIFELEEVRILFHEHVSERAAGVERETEHVGEDFAFREAFVLRVVAEGADDVVEHVLGVLAIHDREARLEAGFARVPPQDARADAVKRAAPQPGEVVRDERGHAVEHLAGGLVGEGEEQDVPRGDPVFH